MSNDSNSNWLNDILNIVNDKPKGAPVGNTVYKPKGEEKDILGMLSSLGFLSGDAPQSKAKTTNKKTVKTESKKQALASLMSAQPEQVVNYVVNDLSWEGYSSEKIYDTVDDLVVPDTKCTHYWQIPSEGVWQVGVCKYCNGEKWFSNSYSVLMQDHPSFNNSPFTINDPDALAKKQALKDIQALERSLNLDIDSALAGGMA